VAWHSKSARHEEIGQHKTDQFQNVSNLLRPCNDSRFEHVHRVLVLLVLLHVCVDLFRRQWQQGLTTHLTQGHKGLRQEAVQVFGQLLGYDLWPSLLVSGVCEQREVDFPRQRHDLPHCVWAQFRDSYFVAQLRKFDASIDLVLCKCQDLLSHFVRGRRSRIDLQLTVAFEHKNAAVILVAELLERIQVVFILDQLCDLVCFDQLSESVRPQSSGQRLCAKSAEPKAERVQLHVRAEAYAVPVRPVNQSMRGSGPAGLASPSAILPPYLLLQTPGRPAVR